MRRSWNLKTFAIYRATCERRIGMCGYTSSLTNTSFSIFCFSLSYSLHLFSCLSIPSCLPLTPTRWLFFCAIFFYKTTRKIIYRLVRSTDTLTTMTARRSASLHAHAYISKSVILYSYYVIAKMQKTEQVCPFS